MPLQHKDPQLANFFQILETHWAENEQPATEGGYCALLDLEDTDVVNLPDSDHEHHEQEPQQEASSPADAGSRPASNDAPASENPSNSTSLPAFPAIKGLPFDRDEALAFIRARAKALEFLI